MKSGTGWYKEHGRTYHVNNCQSCNASVTVTHIRMEELRSLNKHLPHIHRYFDENVPCCKDPNFFWVSLA
ncbi:hypothetical protein LCGC14_1436990 [marine sediment metagenome]|uniref:Uncharacterized protein n=1 Tax=marine sediment metagenome TaxID=412755 RepID=A0A0F9JLY6_9ZZZZ